MTAVEAVRGDTLEATELAARKGYADVHKGIDKNLLSTRDLVPVVNHSPVLDSFLGGRFDHRWTGPEWGEGERILDPLRKTGIGARTWDDVKMCTDAFGTRRLHTLDEHIAQAVQLGVPTYPEAKAQPILEGEAFWEVVREIMERHGHPFVMMTLSGHGKTWLRVKSAKIKGAYTAILPRGQRPANFETLYRPWTDALWGPAWGALG